MELDILQAIQTGGDAGLLIIGFVLIRMEGRVKDLEMHRKYQCPKGTQSA